jgi:hypothetical protein
MPRITPLGSGVRHAPAARGETIQAAAQNLKLWPEAEAPLRLLRCAHAQRDARRVRHATDQDLDQLEPLLAELRKLPQLRERKRGSFSRSNRAFLHFHEHAGALYVDVRLESEFQRLKVTSHTEQGDFLSLVQAALH